MRQNPCLPLAACCLIMGLFAHPAFAGAEMPVKGMAMDRVEQAFGQPLEVRGPVGEPPITRWVYEGYTVYFEHRHVIHSVVSRDLPTMPAAAADNGSAGAPPSD